MPLIKPEIQKILRQAGLEKDRRSKDDTTMEDRLNSAGLDSEAVAEELTALALRSNNEALRLRALETALKVKGALKEQPTQVPTFTIVIQNSSKNLDETQGVNPILFPRQVQSSPLLAEDEPEPEEIN